jgi:hypothetical protein
MAQANLEALIECVPRPRRWLFRNYKPAKLRLFYSGDDSATPENGTFAQ